MGEVVYGLGTLRLKPEPGAGLGRRRGLAGDAVGRARVGDAGWPATRWGGLGLATRWGGLGAGMGR